MTADDVLAYQRSVHPQRGDLEDSEVSLACALAQIANTAGCGSPAWPDIVMAVKNAMGAPEYEIMLTARVTEKGTYLRALEYRR
ncbi:MAG: hypothetical protein ABIL09_12995 [Gemmatimonadota bacterium]